MRRKTLGPQDAIRRSTLDPGAAGMLLSSAADGARSASQSVLPAKREDPRPLKDPAWKKEKAQALVDFLSRHGWPRDRAFDWRTLCHCPTNGEVLALLNFLLQLLPGGTVRLASLDGDEVTGVLRRLMKYPYGIPVARKVVQITPLTWHAMFGAIVWLMERLEKVEQPTPMDSSDPAAACSLRDLHRWTRRLYQTALAGDQEWVQADADFIQTIERQARAEQQAADAAEAAVVRWRQRVTELRRPIEERAAKQQQEATLMRDDQNFALFLERLTEHTASKEVAVAAEERLCADLQREVAGREQTRAVVQQSLQTQEISKDDEEQLARGKARLHSQLAEQSAHLKVVTREVQLIEGQMQAAVDRVEAGVHEFSNSAALLLIYPGAKHMFPGPGPLRVNRDTLADPHLQDFQLLLPDPKGVLSFLEALQNRYHTKRQVAAERQRVLHAELLEQQEVRRQRGTEAEVLRGELALLERSCEDAAQKRRSLAALEEELDTNRLRHEREKEQLSVTVYAGISRLLAFKETVQGNLDGVLAACESRLSR